MQILVRYTSRFTHFATLLLLLQVCNPQASAETRLLSASWHLESHSEAAQDGDSGGGTEVRIINTGLIGPRQLATSKVAPGAGANSTVQIAASEIPDGFTWTTSLTASTSAAVSNLLGHYASADATAILVFEVQSDGLETFSLPQAIVYDVNAPSSDPLGQAICRASAGAAEIDATPMTFQIGFGVTEIRISQQVLAVTNNPTFTPPEPNRALHFNHSRSIHFTNLVIDPGALQRIPKLPTSNGGGGRSYTYVFTNPSPRRWFDPPMAQGFTFTAAGTGQFTQIMGFPSGLGSAFRISVDGTDLGSFPANGTVDFEELLGHAVSNFQVKGIQPFVDATSPTAFPIMLDFTEDMTDFTMASIAAPDIKLLTLGNGDLQITFDGVLQSSPDLSPTSWTDVTPTPASPLVVPKAQQGAMKFFRSREPVTP